MTWKRKVSKLKATLIDKIQSEKDKTVKKMKRVSETYWTVSRSLTCITEGQEGVWGHEYENTIGKKILKT